MLWPSQEKSYRRLYCGTFPRTALKPGPVSNKTATVMVIKKRIRGCMKSYIFGVVDWGPKRRCLFTFAESEV